MAAKKVDALEERLEGEMSQIKETMKDRISSVENKVSDLHAMMKKILENQIAASETKEAAGKTTSSVYHRRDDEVENMEGQGYPILVPVLVGSVFFKSFAGLKLSSVIPVFEPAFAEVLLGFESC
ncbi:hypothetical protein M5K25_013523 [Dendrobium thyrsiflorum]|uniref:Uncharacterized protein n=1 Tax=Dendrobium thyrsiflorum TaxID=117978 RepID=A0ABD0V0F9_DENTH